MLFKHFKNPQNPSLSLSLLSPCLLHGNRVSDLNCITCVKEEEESEKVLSGSREGKSDRLALLDILNDPAIFRLSLGSLEISSSAAKNSGPTKQTLSNKVEEDADFPHFPRGLETDDLQQETPRSCKNFNHRIHALLFDSPGKAEISNTSTFSSELTFQEREIQVGDDYASSQGEEEMEQVDYEEVIREVEGYGKEIVVEDEAGLINEQCEGLIEVGELEDDAYPCSVQANAISGQVEEVEEVEYKEVIREVEDYGKEMLVEDEGGLINELCEGLIEVKVIGKPEDDASPCSVQTNAISGEVEEMEEVEYEEVKREVEDYGKEILVEDEGGLINELCEGLIEVKVIEELEDDASLCSVQANAISGEVEDMEEVEYEEVMREVEDYGKEILVENEGGLINELCEGLIEAVVTRELEDYYEKVRGEVNDHEESMELEDGGLIDESCEGMERVYVRKKGRMPGFRGRHTRFIDNSDDKIEDKEEVREDVSSVSPSILFLKGMPIPEGKHLRFPEEED